jgi:hypothetical protein
MHFHRFKTKSLRAKTTGAREFVWPLTICLRHADEKSQLIYGTESRCPGGSSSQGCCHHMDTYIIALHTQANQQCVKCCQRSRNSYTKVDKGLVFTDITHIVAHHRYCVSHTCAPRKLGASHTLLHFSLLPPTSYLLPPTSYLLPHGLRIPCAFASWCRSQLERTRSKRRAGSPACAPASTRCHHGPRQALSARLPALRPAQPTAKPAQPTASPWHYTP